MRGNITNY